jgi:hypothetical protein
MAAKTTYIKNRALDRILKNNADFSYSFPATVYAALFTADPTDSGSLTNEVTGGSYARQAITWGTISGGSIANSAAVTFPVATASWGTVTHAGICDLVSSGNMMYHGSLGTSKTIGTGDQVSFAIGALTVSET